MLLVGWHAKRTLFDLLSPRINNRSENAIMLSYELTLQRCCAVAPAIYRCHRLAATTKAAACSRLTPFIRLLCNLSLNFVRFETIFLFKSNKEVCSKTLTAVNAMKIKLALQHGHKK